MFDRSRSRLLQALTLSLLVHAAFLLAVLSVVPARLAAPPATISAVLRADARQLPRPMALASEPKAPASAALARPVPPGPARRQLVLDPSPLPASVPPSVQATLVDAGAASPVLADSAITPESRPAGSRDSAPASPAALNADDLRQYRVSLAIAARRFKRYPAMARERGWQGTAEVALTLRAGFAEPQVILVRSSGHPVLDRQAQEMMAQAARSSALPEGLQGKDLQIMLPVQFTLDDQ